MGEEDEAQRHVPERTRPDMVSAMFHMKRNSAYNGLTYTPEYSCKPFTADFK